MLKIMRILGVFLACLALAGTSALAAKPIKIGVINPTKTLVGKQGIQGATLAAEMINAQGGILGGSPIELIIYDTNFMPAEGVSAVSRLLTQDGVRIVTGGVSSSVALAAIPVIQAEDAILISTVPKHPDVTASGYDKIFRMNSTTAMDSEFFDHYLATVLKPEKVAVMAENSDFGLITIENVKKLFGSKVVFAEPYGMTQSDFNSMVTNARASGADVVCIAGSNMEQYGNILRALADLGFKGTRCVMPGILNSEGIRVAGKAAEGAVSADIYVPSVDNDFNREFVAAFEAKYGNKPEKVELLGFESVWIAAKAMEAAGSATDVNKIAAIIHETKWQTPRGDVNFDASGQASSGGLIMLEVRDGALVPAE